MKRRIFMNRGPNVQMYATESTASTNSNNCASGCGSCGGGSSSGNSISSTIVSTMGSSMGSSIGSIGGDAISHTLGGALVVVSTSGNPDD